MSGIIALLLAVAKAVPALSGLISKLVDVFREMDARRNEAKALKRRDEKKDRNQQAVDGVLHPPAGPDVGVRAPPP